MEVYKSDYQVIRFYAEQGIMAKQWTPDTLNMDEVTFVSEVEKIAETAEQHKAQCIMDDTSKFAFPITPKLQEWVDTQVFPRFIAAGLKKYALLVSEEMIAQLSIEQTMEGEKGEQAFEIAYFSEAEAAMKWLAA
ncbi:hypothetical protein [Eisenibacter elegans]|jgi:hypothetical protein|uniref:hypothetical protein n=1 Tax=Eisenibacter elegans TaxID=997 RepID=UPI0003F6A2BD|nr:hypothetical protein [Eisenibacter elegans]